MSKVKKVVVKWSKKEQDWKTNFESNAGKAVGRAFFDMIKYFERHMEADWQGRPTGFINIRHYLSNLGYDPDTLTISVKTKPTTNA